MNKSSEKFKSGYVRKLPYSTKWKRIGTDSGVVLPAMGENAL